MWRVPFFPLLWRHVPVRRHVLLHLSLLSSVCPIIAPPPPSVQSGAGRGEALREEGCSLWRKCSLSHSLSLLLFLPCIPHSYTFWLKYYLCHTFKITHMLIPTRTVSCHMVKHWFICLFSQAHMSTRTHLHPNTHTLWGSLRGWISGGASVLCPVFLLPFWTVVSPLQRKGLERKWDLLRDLMFFFLLQFVPVKHTR